MNSAQGLNPTMFDFDPTSGTVVAEIVHGSRGSKMITVLGKDVAPNKSYIELIELSDKRSNVVNDQASAPITLDPPFSRVFQIHDSRKVVKKKMKKKMPQRVLTTE